MIIKKAISTLFFILMLIIAKAQTSEPLLFSVIFEFIHINDLQNKQNPIKKEMLLQIGKTKAKYSNYSYELRVKESNKNNLLALNPNGRKVVSGFPVAIVNSDNSNSEIYFQIPIENKLVRYEEFGMQLYRIESSLKPIEWNLSSETKIIEGYLCQKATGHFGGRDYTVWFTNALPFNYGPWKLWGLPGLILEAYDTNREVQFLCKQILKNNSKEEFVLFKQERTISISEERLSKAKARFYNDPLGIANATLQDKLTGAVVLQYIDSGGKVLTGEAAKNAVNIKRLLVENNPLELSN